MRSAIHPGVVPGHVHRGQTVALQQEAGDVAGQRLGAHRTVPGRQGCDRQRADGHLRPRRQAGDVLDPPRGRRRGQHQRDTVQEGPTGHVQVVEVLVVGQQDGVHRAQLVRADGRSGELGQHPRRLVGARFVERRVGEQRDAAQSEDEGRAADQQGLDRGSG